MVVLIKGTDKSKNFAPQVLAFMAGLSATKHFKKTLVLQLTTKYPVENYVLGKRISEQEIGDNLYLFDDTGIDSLTRRAGITSFNESHFQNAVNPMVSSENLFDVLPVSKKVEADVEREITQDASIIGLIIKSAQKIYDNIFVLANGKSPAVVEAVLPYIDKTVTCVSQGIKEEITAPATKDHYYLVTGYDYKSIYSAKTMQKTYGIKSIYIFPYNVEFKDAYTQQALLQFILHNHTPEATDYAYHLVTETEKLLSVLIDDVAEEIEDEYRFTSKSVVRAVNGLQDVYGDDVEVEEVPKKLFRSAKKQVHYSGELLTEEDEDEPLLYTEEEEDDFEEEKDETPVKSRRELRAEAKQAKKDAKAQAKAERKNKSKNKKNAKVVAAPAEEYEEEDDWDEEYEEEVKPTPKKKSRKPAPVVEEYEDDDDTDFYEEDEDEEEYVPAPKKTSKPAAKKPAKKAPVVVEEEDEDFYEDDEEEEVVVPKKSTKKSAPKAEPKKKRPIPQVEEEEDEDEEYEEEEVPVKPAKKAPAKKAAPEDVKRATKKPAKKAPVIEEEDEEEYEEEPVAKPVKKAPAKKPAPKYSQAQIDKAIELLEGGYSYIEVTEYTGIPRNVLKEAMGEQ